MSMPTNDEIGVKLQAWRESHDRHLATLVDRMENEAQGCLDAMSATGEQKAAARSVLLRCSELRQIADCTESPIPEAVLAGLYYGALRELTLKGPAESGERRGVKILGTWIELSALPRRVTNYITSHISSGGAKIDLQEIVRECWGERYHAKNLSKYRKLFSTLNTRFLDNDPPIRVTLTIRDAHLVVEFLDA